MGYRVEVMERPKDKVLGAPVSTPAREAGPAIGSAIGVLLARAAEAGCNRAGRPKWRS